MLSTLWTLSLLIFVWTPFVVCPIGAVLFYRDSAPAPGFRSFLAMLLAVFLFLALGGWFVHVTHPATAFLINAF